VGLASYHPIGSNDTAEGRVRNRRVTVTILAPALEHPAQNRVEEKAELKAE
jgi:hypothetical protein